MSVQSEKYLLITQHENDGNDNDVESSPTKKPKSESSVSSANEKSASDGEQSADEDAMEVLPDSNKNSSLQEDEKSESAVAPLKKSSRVNKRKPAKSAKKVVSERSAKLSDDGEAAEKPVKKSARKTSSKKKDGTRYSGPMTFVSLTNFPPTELVGVIEQLEDQDWCHVLDSVDDRTTCLVSGVPESGPGRTSKVLEALSRGTVQCSFCRGFCTHSKGIPIVEMDWISASISNGKATSVVEHLATERFPGTSNDGT